MSEIQRYSEEGGHSCDDVYMCADDCGEWVRYEEHKARIQELEEQLVHAEIKGLERAKLIVHQFVATESIGNIIQRAINKLLTNNKE